MAPITLLVLSVLVLLVLAPRIVGATIDAVFGGSCHRRPLRPAPTMRKASTTGRRAVR